MSLRDAAWFFCSLALCLTLAPALMVPAGAATLNVPVLGIAMDNDAGTADGPPDCNPDEEDDGSCSAPPIE
ncbi:MAG: hypothetical protein IPK79_05750 [Vampirovibrionales bacterium]|nr:hypothetical protein [Vampirovibrionales bacterium]